MSESNCPHFWLPRYVERPNGTEMYVDEVYCARCCEVKRL